MICDSVRERPNRRSQGDQSSLYPSTEGNGEALRRENDSRKNAAFLAYLPAVPRKTFADFRSKIVNDRPLYDPNAAGSRIEVVADALLAAALPDENKLPRVKLSDFRLPQSIRSLIEDGVKKGGRNEALRKVYLALHEAGASPAQIAAVCWDEANGISAKPRDDRNYEWLRKDIFRVLGTVTKQTAALNEELFDRYIYVEQQKLYFDTAKDVGLDHEQFANRYAATRPPRSNRNAHLYWQMYWERLGGKRVDNFTYWPGKDRIVEFQSKQCLNRWSPPTDLELPKPRSVTCADAAEPLYYWASLDTKSCSRGRISRLDGLCDPASGLKDQPSSTAGR